jgi:anthranilate phosphoribosyltransferase
MNFQETIGDLALRQITSRLMQGEHLTRMEAGEFLHALLHPDATDAQIAAALAAMAVKGESVEELAGMAAAMRASAVPLSSRHARFIDTAGTGSSAVKTFNVSTAAAFVIAGAGLPVAKHGSRAVTSRAGSADVLEALGVKVTAPPAVVERCLSKAGIAFFFAPTFHPAMRHAAPARKELGVRTAFNLLGPLTNPAGASRQIVGVPRPELTELIARALMLLGSERAWVVHGADGLDELSTTGHTKVSECRAGAVQTFYVHPSDFGLSKVSPETLKGADAPTNAQRIVDVLSGTPGPPRDVVLLNAGAALFVAGHAESVRQGIAKAADAIDSGRAKAVLSQLVEVSQEPES